MSEWVASSPFCHGRRTEQRARAAFQSGAGINEAGSLLPAIRRGKDAIRVPPAEPRLGPGRLPGQ
eukprot:7655555-Lingulodinium_polyedra.AAC.1